MVKYRRLSIEELEQLEDSFIRFLAAQSIAGEDWKKIQETDKTRHGELLDQFSDVVIEKTLHNVKFLEHRTPRRILFFEFFDDNAKLFGIEFKSDPPFSLLEGFELKKLADIINDKTLNHSFINGEKKYDKDKLLEIFDVIQQGAQIPANNDLFNFMLNFFESKDK